MSERIYAKGRQVAKIQLIGSLSTVAIGLLILAAMAMTNKLKPDQKATEQNKFETVNKNNADSVIVQKIR
ncbi:MAG: hypothetical protein IJY99_01355 [Alphaproteobacteria bacterium]|nr:hypothetical protein [Alphaproteobacteria bacterium]